MELNVMDVISQMDDFNSRNPPPPSATASTPTRLQRSSSSSTPPLPAQTARNPPQATEETEKLLCAERRQRIRFLPVWSDTHVEYTLITLRETGSETRYLFLTEFIFPNFDGVPIPQEIRVKIKTTEPTFGVSPVTVAEFVMQAKKDAEVEKDFCAVIVSDYDMFEADLLKKRVGDLTPPKVCVLILDENFKELNSRYEENYGVGLMDCVEYSRCKGDADGKHFIEKYVFGKESVSQEFRKLLVVSFGALTPNQNRQKCFTAVVLEGNVFLLPVRNEMSEAAEVFMAELQLRMFGDLLVKTKLDKRVKFLHERRNIDVNKDRNKGRVFVLTAKFVPVKGNLVHVTMKLKQFACLRSHQQMA